MRLGGSVLSIIILQINTYKNIIDNQTKNTLFFSKNDEAITDS